jgi:hypothetical protein
LIAVGSSALATSGRFRSLTQASALPHTTTIATSRRGPGATRSSPSNPYQQSFDRQNGNIVLSYFDDSTEESRR